MFDHARVPMFVFQSGYRFTSKYVLNVSLTVIINHKISQD